MRKIEYYRYKITDSVLDRLKEYAALGQNCVCVADLQTKGRGTKGRNFFCKKGCGAYFGVLYFPSFDQDLYHLVTPAAAVAVALSADELCLVNTGIKWVNDVYFADKKICGILTESGQNEYGRYLIIGIGINLSEPEGGFPEEIKDKAGFLPGNADRDRIVEKVVDKLLSYLDSLKEKRFVDLYVQKNILLNKRVDYSSGNASGSGMVEGFDEKLGIIILTDNGRVTLSSGRVILNEDNQNRTT